MRASLEFHLIALPSPYFPFIYQAPCGISAFTPPWRNYSELIIIFFMVNEYSKIFNKKI